MDFKSKLNRTKIPEHIAIIMDGNGRWAKKQGYKRTFGHKNGAVAVEKTIEAAVEIGLKYITLYAFSTENWKRPQTEVNIIMSLLVQTIKKQTVKLSENNIKLEVIGDIKKLSKKVKLALNGIIDSTKNNTGLTLILALNYGSRQEIIEAVKSITEEVKSGKLETENINENIISEHLFTSEYPDPELLIRTSGEYRISNFLLWQIAYTELYFPNVLWPDFEKENLYEAIYNYQQRNRRFGNIG